MAQFTAAELIGKTRERRGGQVEFRERVTTVGMAVAFLAVAVPLAMVDSARAVSIPAAAVLIVAYASASLVEFEVGTGTAVPTQLVFVPMLFLLPIGVVPLAAAGGYVVGDVIRASLRRGAPVRPMVLLGSSWYAVGPTVVLLAAGEGPPTWHRWPLYAAAFLAQFAVDATITVVADVCALGVRPSLSLRAIGWVYAVDAMLSPVGLVFTAVALHEPLVIVAVLPLLAVMAWFARDRRAHIDALLDLSRTYRGTALVLGNVIEADDSYTGLHSRNVLDLSLAIADRLGLEGTARREVEFTALLHDVGKLRIPKAIINKAGPLTAEERKLVETHTSEGERMLAGIGGFLSHIGVLVRSCHERYDGMGYPDGLAGDSIPIAARIVFCCDAYDAMTTDRPYRRARPQQVALDELAATAGSQFDPVVVRALRGILADAHSVDIHPIEPMSAAPVLSIHVPARRSPAATSPVPPEDAVANHVAEAVRERERVEHVRARARVAPKAASYLVGGAFAVIALALPLIAGGPIFATHTVAVFAALTAAYAGVYGIDFQLGPGSAIPAQLVFIPMLVLLPPTLVPLAVGVGILARSAWDSAESTCPARQRPFVLLAGGWYTIGPALLLAAGNPSLGWALLGLLVLIQILVDAAINVVRVHVMLGFPLRPLMRNLAWAYAADLALTPIAFTVVAPDRVGQIPAILSGIALVSFLALLASERSRHLARTEQLTDAYREAADRARRDTLTGLANRLGWDEALSALPAGRPATVIVLDVNGLKAANDSRGHGFGDQILIEVTKVMLEAAPDATLSARLGGDEFGILITRGAADCAPIVDRLRALFDEHPGLDGVRVEAAVGSASTPPHPDIRAAIHAADRANYAEKRRTGNSRRIA